MLKYVIFDFDGTIADTFKVVFNKINEFAPKYGFEQVTDAQIESFRDQSLSATIKQLKIPNLILPILVYKIQKAVQKEILNTLVSDGLDKVLQQLQSEYKLSIVTSNLRNVVVQYLKLNKIEYFESVLSQRNLMGKEKSIMKYLRSNKINENEAIYIGDEVRDFEACKRINMPFIGVTWGYNSKIAFENAGCTKIVNTPEELYIRIKST